MVAIEKTGTKKTGSDEQYSIVLFAVKAHEGNDTDEEGQYGGDRLRQSVKLLIALPT